MNLTLQQRAAVRCSDNALIIACPGSGKTRTLVAKLLHCLEEVRDTSRKIACLTYTNAAVYEIENRLRKYGKCGDEVYCDVSTIHSFCLVNILNNFYWRIPEYSNGFSVITPDSEIYRKTAIDILTEYGLPPQLQDYFESFNREIDGAPIVPPDVHQDVALAFWKRLEEQGLIDFPNIIYYAFKLLRERPGIAYALACKYAWFLVDEFQDTTALQVDLFRTIAGFKQTKFFLVGDPYQSIFGFAGAQVGLMQVFAEEISAKTDFRLHTNFRSSDTIIYHAEKLCPRSPRMCGIERIGHKSIQPIYVHTTTAFEAITDYFLPALEKLGIPYGEAAILAPWWIKLWHLGRGLRDYGIPIVGPGARPYKKSHLFAILSEQICAYISHPSAKIFYQIKKELILLLNVITGEHSHNIYSYHGNVVVCKLISEGNEIYRSSPRAVDWLIRAAEAFASILISDNLISNSDGSILSESANNIVADLIKNKIDIGNLSVDDLGLFASTERNLHLLTMHRAKGREFDAVAIVDLHEGRVPDFRAIRNGDIEGIEESKRLLYVSITRARRFLMYVSDDEDLRNGPSRFLSADHLELARVS